MAGKRKPIRIDAQLNNFATVTIIMLRRAGLFAGQANPRCGFAIGEVKIAIGFMPESDSLKLLWHKGDTVASQRVLLAYRDTKIGRRVYFVCPETYRRCVAISLQNGRFISSGGRKKLGKRTSPRQAERAAVMRKFYRLWGLDGRGPARGANRVALLEAMEREPWMRLFAEQTAAALDKEFVKLERVKARPLRSSARNRVRSVGAGFEDSLSAEVAADAYDWAKLLPVDARRRRPQVRDLPVAIVEDHHGLSVDAMLTAGMLVRGALAVRTLELTGAGSWVVECHLERPGEALVFVRLQASAKGQIVRLDYNTRLKRWAMVCPYGRTPCRTLYLRDGVFASTASNRLVHRSQRKGIRPDPAADAATERREREAGAPLVAAAAGASIDGAFRRQAKLDRASVIAALKASHGIRSVAAQTLGVAPTTLRVHLRYDPTLLAEVAYRADPSRIEAERIIDGAVTEKRLAELRPRYECYHRSPIPRRLAEAEVDELVLSRLDQWINPGARAA